MTKELTKAMNLLQQFEVPFLFLEAKKSAPETLIKFIADQAQGRLADQVTFSHSDIAYKATTRMFNQQLVDACIKAYPNE